jgi:hypothetical protein
MCKPPSTVQYPYYNLEGQSLYEKTMKKIKYSCCCWWLSQADLPVGPYEEEVIKKCCWKEAQLTMRDNGVMKTRDQAIILPALCKLSSFPESSKCIDRWPVTSVFDDALDGIFVTDGTNLLWGSGCISKSFYFYTCKVGWPFYISRIWSCVLYY